MVPPASLVPPVAPRAPPTTVVVHPTSHPSVHRVASLEDLDERLATATTPTVVRFYSESCRACKAGTPAFYRMVSKHTNEVQFLEVPASAATKAVFQRCGVTKYPFGQVYERNASTGEVEMVHEGSLIRNRLSTFEKGLEAQLAPLTA